MPGRSGKRSCAPRRFSFGPPRAHRARRSTPWQCCSKRVAGNYTTLTIESSAPISIRNVWLEHDEECMRSRPCRIFQLSFEKILLGRSVGQPGAFLHRRVSQVTYEISQHEPHHGRWKVSAAHLSFHLSAERTDLLRATHDCSDNPSYRAAAQARGILVPGPF